MRYFKHTHRPGFLLGFIDFFTAGIFSLVYMKADGLQEEIEFILGHKVMPYWKEWSVNGKSTMVSSRIRNNRAVDKNAVNVKHKT